MLTFIIFLYFLSTVQTQDLLFIQEDIILELPSFNQSNCRVANFPVKGYWQNTGIVSNRMAACFSGECWSLNAGKWTSIANMNTVRINAASSNSSRGWMVTGGGYNRDGEPWNTSEVFVAGSGESDDGQWDFGPELPVGYDYHCQVQAEDFVFVTGGITGSIQGDSLDISDLGYQYSPDTGIWQELNSKMVTARFEHSCAYKDGKIYIMGGLNTSVFKIDSVEIYDLTSGNWSEGPSLPSLPKYWTNAVTYDNELYLIGLSDGIIWQLNTVSDKWVAVATSAYDNRRQFNPPQVIQSDSCATGTGLIPPETVSTTSVSTIPPESSSPISQKGCKCGPVRGDRKHNLQEKIFGGKPAGNNYPWIALVFVDSKPRCGGVIVNSRWILTALHCVVKDLSNLGNVPLAKIKDEIIDFTGGKANVYLGAKKFNRRGRLVKSKRTLKLEIEDILHNPDGADLAMIKIKTNINIQTYPPICIPSIDEELDLDDRATLAGFGQNNSVSDKLMVLSDIMLQNVSNCWAGPLVPDNWFCFEGNTALHACKGDSGGPVMVKTDAPDGEPRWTLAGIISGGINPGCGGPGLAVSVYWHSNWIRFTGLEGEYCQL